MRTLGVGTAMYDQMEEERARMEEVGGEIINVNGDTGTWTRTITHYNPKTNTRQNVHYKGR